MACVLLGFLVARKQQQEPGCTPFFLAHRVPGLKTQRQERVQEILELLEKAGHVKSTESDRFRIYEATEMGIKWNLEVASRFYAVFDRLYKNPDSL